MVDPSDQELGSLTTNGNGNDHGYSGFGLLKPPPTTPSSRSRSAPSYTKPKRLGGESTYQFAHDVTNYMVVKASLQKMLIAMLAMIVGMLVMVTSTVETAVAVETVEIVHHDDKVPTSSKVATSSSSSGSLGSTGKRFSGIKIRKYSGRRSFQDVTPLQHSIFGIDPAPSCVQWAVVTTIHEPNESILGVSKLHKWCIVIVGDTITPNDKYKDLAEKKENVFFLSASYQQQKSLQVNPFIKKMPFKSFARKNIGYLFAVYYGAKVIYDFDDDNILMPLEDGETIPPPFHYIQNVGFEGTVLLKFVPISEHDEAEKSLAFNPYAYMNPSHEHSWPRGFPIDQLQKSFKASNATRVGDIKYSSIGIIQSLCNGDPDNDAIFRLTRPGGTKFTFERSKKSLPLLIPASAYSPYNAQATTHLYSAFWGLYLPISVPGRVTDIWRSYITQRIMKDIGLHVVYTPPIVNHERTDHDYLADFEAESDLYRKTTALLMFLDNWSPSSAADTGAEIIFELWIALYEHDYIGLSDVEAVEEWLKVLVAIGYEFPNAAGVQRDTKESAWAQPSLEGQPYRSFPHYHLNAGEHGLVTRPEGEVLKLIVMTKDEWPLLKSWVLYHGYVLGFEHLYVLDSSSDTRCTSFLRYARDTLGVNVLFTSANLNELESVMTKVGKEIAGSCDYIIKMDTDEFLVVYDNSTKALTTSISDYLANKKLRLNGDSRIGYKQWSLPSQEVCNQDVHSTPDKFPLTSESTFIGEGQFSYYKMVYNTKIPFQSINLGGHAHSVKAGIWTDFGVVDYHFRCLEIEVENCKRALESHGFIKPSDTDSEATASLARMFGCTTEDVCNTCSFSTTFTSYHKALFYLKWLNCREEVEAEYYNEASAGAKRVPSHAASSSGQNTDLMEAMQTSHELFSPFPGTL